jgi:hypothetical protein
MSWRAQSRSKDAKTPSAAGVRSQKPELGCCPIQPYIYLLVLRYPATNTRDNGTNAASMAQTLLQWHKRCFSHLYGFRLSFRQQSVECCRRPVASTIRHQLAEERRAASADRHAEQSEDCGEALDPCTASLYSDL